MNDRPPRLWIARIAVEAVALARTRRGARAAIDYDPVRAVRAAVEAGAPVEVATHTIYRARDLPSAGWRDRRPLYDPADPDLPEGTVRAHLKRPAATFDLERAGQRTLELEQDPLRAAINALAWAEAVLTRDAARRQLQDLIPELDDLVGAVRDASWDLEELEAPGRERPDLRMLEVAAEPQPMIAEPSLFEEPPPP